MVTMPRDRIEEQHDAMPNVSMWEYLAHFARRNRRTLPPLEHKEGTVKAELYRGLWIARCPEDDCANAITVTSLNPIMFCTDCGAGWFDVLFPPNKVQIEHEVMKRPTARRGLVHANWDPYGGPRGEGESMYLLRKQTKARGNV
tara:strand:- start:307 stop:738 length:432 start_codon:yes stop_codon:yes gene_type:complete